jgi:hypothetical protein
MRYRKLDATGDYTLGTGSDFHVDTPAAVSQAILTRLRLIAGEWFLDTTDGTPWRTEILGKYSAAAYDSVLKGRILGTEGVSSIDSYSSSIDSATRKLKVSATVTTIYGQATLQTTL